MECWGGVWSGVGWGWDDTTPRAPQRERGFLMAVRNFGGMGWVMEFGFIGLRVHEMRIRGGGLHGMMNVWTLLYGFYHGERICKFLLLAIY